jgi:CRP/FNR family transcriptional regulator, nitrogen fixation regulation protein
VLTQPEVRGPDPAVYRAPPPPAYVLGRASEAAPTIHLMGTVTSYPRNTEIFGESEPADYLYDVINGGVRTYKIFSDGRRQIGGFYLPGDVVGLEFARARTFSAEAIADTRLRVIKRGALAALAGRDPEVANELFALTTRELRRVQQRMLLLAKTAQERVASFSWKWRSAAWAATPSTCPCRARTSPTISA